MHTRRRWIISITLILLSGAIVNVGVVWGLVARERSVWRPGGMSSRIIFDADQPMMAYVLGERPVWRAIFIILPHGALDFEGDSLAGWASSQNPLPDITLIRMLRSSRPHNSTTFPLDVIAAGWPALALWRPVVWRRSFAPFPHSIWDVTLLEVLPFRPLFPGFAINSLFYASILTLPYLGFVGFVGLCRMRRKKIGHCPTCAYDLSATPNNMPCPECGRAQPLTFASTSPA